MQIQNNIFASIDKKIDSYTDAMVEMQRRLVAIPALAPKNSGDGEWDKMQYIKQFINELGLTVEEFNAPDKLAKNDIRPNIISTIKGNNREKTFWIMSHLDVVPPGELRLWESNPYKLKIEGNRLYGRGTEDNHQGLVASIFCAKVFLDEKITPEVNIGLVIVSDEETGSEFGIRYMLENYDVFKKDDLILVPDSGNSRGDMIEVAEKTMLWLKFTTTGRQCHASTPAEGANSFRAASYLITKLDSLYKIFSKQNNLFKPPISTFEPTRKDHNVPNINTIPGEDVFYMDCRILPDYKPGEIIKETRKICNLTEKEFNVKIAIETTILDEAAPITPSNAPIVSALACGIKKVYSVDAKPMGIGGGTVASHFRKRGYNVAVWSKIEHSAHQPNEYCLIEDMVGDAKVMAHVCLHGKV